MVEESKKAGTPKIVLPPATADEDMNGPPRGFCDNCRFRLDPYEFLGCDDHSLGGAVMGKSTTPGKAYWRCDFCQAGFYELSENAVGRLRAEHLGAHYAARAELHVKLRQLEVGMPWWLRPLGKLIGIVADSLISQKIVSLRPSDENNPREFSHD